MSVCGFLFKLPTNATTGVAWQISKLLPGRSHCSWRIIPGLFSYVDTVQLCGQSLNSTGCLVFFQSDIGSGF